MTTKLRVGQVWMADDTAQSIARIKSIKNYASDDEKAVSVCYLLMGSSEHVKYNYVTKARFVSTFSVLLYDPPIKEPVRGYYWVSVPGLSTPFIAIYDDKYDSWAYATGHKIGWNNIKILSCKLELEHAGKCE